MKYDVTTMDRSELENLQNAVKTRLSDMHCKDLGNKKKEFLASPTAMKLAQRLQALRAQFATLTKKKANKIKLEVEIEVSLTGGDTELFGGSSHNYPSEVFDYEVTGKVLNAKDFHKDIQSQLQDSLDNALADLCGESLKLDLATFEDMESFLEEVNELNDTLYDYNDDFELTTDDLDDLLKPKRVYNTLTRKEEDFQPAKKAKKAKKK